MKTVLISGGNRGIGFECVRKFSKNGYQVYLGSRNFENGLHAVDKLDRMGYSNIIPIQLDIVSEVSLKEAEQNIRQHTSALDTLVNNAGIRGLRPQNPTSIDLENIKAIFETNFFGTIRLTQQMIPLLKASENPRIINISSELASLTLHDNENWKFYNFKDAGYGPSKTALNAFTVMLAYELRNTSFKINSVDPGYTATEFNGFKGTGCVSDAADLIFKYATIVKSGPTGQFLSKEGELPW